MSGPLQRYAVIFVLLVFSTNVAFALPSGPQIANGQVSFNTLGNNLTVTNSPNSIINWLSFSIGGNEAVRFIQQNSASAVLNRITGQSPSQIFGLLQSNGRVFLVNPNGILFGQGSQINVAGLVASTLNINDQDFLAGKYNFTAGAVAGSIQHQGTITTPSGGSVYLIAPNIENSGIITSPQGTVLLAAGHSVQLVDSSNPDIAVVVSSPTDQAVNLGQIIAQSGTVGIYGALISQKGLVSADSATVGANGKIIFKASKSVTLDEGSVTSAQGGGTISVLADMQNGTVNVAGTLDASAPNGGNGGFIETSAASVKIADTAYVTTLAPYGKTGTWLIDPPDFTIDANPTVGDISGAALGQELDLTSIIIHSADGLKNTSGNGDIFVNDSISWSHPTTLSLLADRNININQAIQGSNSGSGVVLTASTGSISGTGVITAGSLTANAATGIGNSQALNTKVSTLSVSNSTSGDINISNNASGGILYVSGTNSASGGDFKVAENSGYIYAYSITAGRDITLSNNTGWIETAGTITSGRDITLTDTGNSIYICGNTVSAIRNINLTADYIEICSNVTASGDLSAVTLNGGLGFYNGGSIDLTGSAPTLSINSKPYTVINSHNYSTLPNIINVNPASYYALGQNMDASTWSSGISSFSGVFEGLGHTISNLNINKTGDSNYIGLFGNNSGTIQNVGLTNVNINVTGNSNYVGGLVGYNSGTVSNAFVTGQSTGSAITVTGNNNFVGGLVGYNSTAGTINNNSYNSGCVTVLGDNNKVGGLAGSNMGSIDSSGNTGGMSVTGTSSDGNFVGGLVGYNDSGGGICWSYNSGGINVNGQGNTNTVGGLVGANQSGNTITGSYNSGPVAAYGNNSIIGGLVGQNSGNITSSYNTATVTEHGDTGKTGGLAGYNNAGTIDSSYNNGDVAVTSNLSDGNAVGGLVGYSDGTIRNASYNSGAVSVTGMDSINYNYVGGLVGQNAGSIDSTYNNGIVTTSGDYNKVGGLVGSNGSNVPGNAAITNSYNTGTVNDSNGSNNLVGGLVGYNCFGNSISYSYSSGLVSGTSASGTQKGGMVGQNDGTITSSYWDMYTSGLTSGVGLDNNSGATTLTGLSSQSGSAFVQNNYAGFDFTSGSPVWYMVPGSTRPFLTSEYSTTISNAHQLQLIGMNATTLSASYTLAKNIDMNELKNSSGMWNSSYNSSTQTWSGTGFVPVGSNANTAFTGSFYGNGYFIDGLYINTTANNVGLFGYSSGYIYNVPLKDVNINGGSGSYIGALVGHNTGSIYYSYSTGTVSTNGSCSGGGTVGGLVGYNDSSGTITNSYSSTNVSTINSGGSDSVGGLVGSNYGSIDYYSYSTGTVTTNGSNGRDSVGGLVGYNDSRGTITNSYSSANVSANSSLGGDSVGGLVGSNYGSIGYYSYSTGTVNTNGSNGRDSVGGLVGYNDSRGTITNSYSSANVSANSSLGGDSVGGLVGSNYGSGSNGISNSYSTGTVTTNGSLDSNSGNANNTNHNNNGNDNVGGLVGYNFGSINNSYSSAVVSTNYSSCLDSVGGLVGFNDIIGSITTSYSSGSVTTTNSSGGESVGGLVGSNYGSGSNGIINSYSTSIVSINGSSDSGYRNVNNSNNNNNGNDNIGGLAGYNNGSINNSYSIGSVSTNGSNGGDSIGGLVGFNDISGSITTSFSTANVSTINSGGGDSVGGLVGSNYGGGSNGISNSYSTGTVTDNSSGSYGVNPNTPLANSGNDYVGGLAGYNNGNINNSYSIGSVSSNGGDSIGGLVGSNSGNIANSYWDATINQGLDNGIGTPLTTNQMMSYNTFQNVWSISQSGTTTPSGNTPWVIYDGLTYPLLKSFLTPLTITASSITKTYDGTPYSGGNGVTYSVPNAYNYLQGTLGYTGTAQGAIDPNPTYTIIPTGLYSNNQQGYDITYVQGTLTITGGTTTTATTTTTTQGSTTTATDTTTTNTTTSPATTALSTQGSTTTATTTTPAQTAATTASTEANTTVVNSTQTATTTTTVTPSLPTTSNQNITASLVDTSAPSTTATLSSADTASAFNTTVSSGSSLSGPQGYGYSSPTDPTVLATFSGKDGAATASTGSFGFAYTGPSAAEIAIFSGTRGGTQGSSSTTSSSGSGAAGSSGGRSGKHDTGSTASDKGNQKPKKTFCN